MILLAVDSGCCQLFCQDAELAVMAVAKMAHETGDRYVDTCAKRESGRSLSGKLHALLSLYFLRLLLRSLSLLLLVFAMVLELIMAIRTE